MRGVCQSERKIPGGIFYFGCEASVGQNENPWRYLPVRMRGVCRSEPKPLVLFTRLHARRFRSEPDLLAVFTNLNAMCLSVRTKIPGDISQFQREASWVRTRIPGSVFQFGRGAFCRSEPNFLAVNATLNARCSSVRTKIPGDIHQFKCEVLFGQIQSSWRYWPVKRRFVFRPDPKFLAILASSNATRFSVRTAAPGDFSKLNAGRFFGQNQNSRQGLPVYMRGAFRSGPKPLAMFTSLNAKFTNLGARRFFGQNQNSWRYFPV